MNTIAWPSLFTDNQKTDKSCFTRLYCATQPSSMNTPLAIANGNAAFPALYQTSVDRRVPRIQISRCMQMSAEIGSGWPVFDAIYVGSKAPEEVNCANV